MEKLLEYFNKHIPLDAPEIEFLKEHAQIVQVPKNHDLLKMGEVSDAFYFVLNGSVRMYYLANGEEKTAYFYTESMFVSSYESFSKQVPASHNITTIEASELVRFGMESVQLFLNFSPKFDALAKIIMEEELSAYQKMLSSFITQNAEDRYKQLMEENPELIQRIPQHQIATFIGVTPETLSRIRKRMVAK